MTGDKLPPLPLMVNARFLTQRVTGSQRFAIEVSRRIKKLRPSAVFVSPRGIIDHELARELGAVVVGRNTGHLWEQLDLVWFAARNGYPLLLNLVNTAPLVYRNKAVTIMDLSWLRFPKAVSALFRLWYGFLVPRIARGCRRVFTISEYSKSDISTAFGISPDKIVNVSCALPGRYRHLNLSREKLILSVASIQPYKNLGKLLEGFAVLRMKPGFEGYKLLLVGGVNRSVFSSDTGLVSRMQAAGVSMAGYVSDSQLEELYNRAALFVTPSLFEGFGLPPLEAMACGCPVVASRAASLPEVCGDAAAYVDPRNEADIAAGMEKVLNDAEYRNRLVENGYLNIARFSWQRTAAAILDALPKDSNYGV